MRKMLGFLRKEIIGLLRTPALLVAIVVMPAVQVVLYGGAITLTANNLRLAIDMTPNDILMEKFYNHAIGSGYFIRADNTTDDAITAVQTGAADVAIVAPSGGLTNAVARGSGEMQILIDATNILKAQSIEGYLQGVLMSTASEIGMNMNNIPIQFTQRILFNPEINTKWFLVPSLVACMIFISLVLLITTSLTKEKELGTFETLLSSPTSKYEIIIYKSIPFILVTFVSMLFNIFVGWLVFDVPFVGSWLMLILTFLVFCFAGTGLAILLANYTKNQQQALLGTAVVVFLCLMLSGALIPSENFPIGLREISFINPLTHFVYLVRNIMLKGASWEFFAYHAGMLLIVGAIIWVWALKKFKVTLN